MRDESAQRALVDQKVDLFQAILDEFSLGTIGATGDAQSFSLSWDVDQDDGGPETCLTFFSLHSHMEPDDDAPYLGVCYHATDDTWDFYGQWHGEAFSEVDREKIAEIIRVLELPETEREGISEEAALGFVRRLAAYFKKQLELERAAANVVPPKRRLLFLNLRSLADASTRRSISAEDLSEALFYLKTGREKQLEYLRSCESGELMLDVVAAAERDGRVGWADGDGREYTEINALLVRNGFPEILGADPEYYRYTNVARRLEQANLPLVAVFR